MKEQAILIDTSHCTGCNSCTYKCIQEFGEHEAAARGTFRTVAVIKDEGVLHQQCMHCKDPQCVKAAKGAMTRSAYGAVLLDVSQLKNGKEVAESCPFHAAHYDDTAKTLTKCNMCAHRVSAGQKPACVDACPAGAIQSGDYDTIVATARQLAASKKLKIYGLKENGGGNVLFLTKASPAVLGYPQVPGRRIQASLGTELGAFPVVAGAVFVGLKKYDERRTEIAKSEQKG